MTQSINARPGTAPLITPQTSQWSVNLGAAAAPLAPAQAPEDPAAPRLGEDAAQGVDGVRTLRETAQGPAPAAPQYELATPPKVDPPKASVPSVSLSGSTENRIKQLTNVQQGQVDAIAAALDAHGFKIDPNKTSIGLSPTQQFYSDLTGVLMGVEDRVKETEAYKTLHKLYVSMPNQLSDQQLEDLSHVRGLLRGFPEMLTKATEMRIDLNKAKADGNKREVDWYEGRFKLMEDGQIKGVQDLVAELQRLNYTIDESKLTLGLSPSQQFYSDIAGVLVSAEEDVKESEDFQTLRDLYASMPSELSAQQLANLKGVMSRLENFEKSVKLINGHRVDLAKARAENKTSEVQRLEALIASETEVQQADVRSMVAELQRLNYKIDPNKIATGLSPTHDFYAQLTGVLMGVEDEVKELPEYQTLHHLYLSMPKQLSTEELEALSSVMGRLQRFPDTTKAITKLQGRINEAKEAKDQRMVEWWEGQIKEVIAAQKRGVQALVSELQALNYTIDPDKIPIGLSPTQQFYSDIVGVLQGAEDDVKKTDEYQRFFQLYLSMPNDLSSQQLDQLEGVKNRMRSFADTVTRINVLRVDIAQARGVNDRASVSSYERQIADLAAQQGTELRAMVAELERLNYKVDPNKTNLGLSPTQRFYSDLVGVLMGVEDRVKETEAYKTLHYLYASMPSQLSDQQIEDLSRVRGLLQGFTEMGPKVIELRVDLNKAKADGNKREVDWYEGRLKLVEESQIKGVQDLVAELQRLNYTIDESKISPGLTPSQAFYNDLSGILTLAEDDVKKSESFKRLAQLYASMPSELSEQQMAQLRGVWAQIRGFDPIADQINALRVQRIAELSENS